MTFTPEQTKALEAPLDPKHVKPAPEGKYGEYIEGYHAICEANRIFGHDGWSYSITTLAQCSMCETTDRNGSPQVRVGYRCTVKVAAGGVEREGAAVGSGMAKPENEADAHESAVKEAETDALKRALRSFGNTFGLALYDKTKANVGHAEQDLPEGPINDETRDWLRGKIDSTGKPVGDFCKAMEVTSLKELTYSHIDAAKAWIRENRKAA